jgi:hypothetical protein
MPITGTMTGPGTVTIVDDAATVIAAQTTAITAQNQLLIAAQNQMNNALNKMLDTSELSSKTLSDVNVALAGIAVALSKMNVIIAASASNQIKTNNFQVQATKDALERSGQPAPKEAPITDQLVESVSDAISMNAAVSASGALISYVQDVATAIGSWLTATVVYKTVEEWVSKSFQSLSSSLVPPSPRTIEANLNSIAGSPALPTGAGLPAGATDLPSSANVA